MGLYVNVANSGKPGKQGNGRESKNGYKYVLVVLSHAVERFSMEGTKVS